MIEQKLAVEICLDEVSDSDDPQRVPLAERGWLDSGRFKLVPPSVILIKSVVVFESVGPDHIVASLRKAKDSAAGSIFPSRDRFEPNGDVNVTVGTSGRDNHVISIINGALDQHPLAAWRVAGLLDTPATVHRFPLFNTLVPRS